MIQKFEIGKEYWCTEMIWNNKLLRRRTYICERIADDRKSIEFSADGGEFMIKLDLELYADHEVATSKHWINNSISCLHELPPVEKRCTKNDLGVEDRNELLSTIVDIVRY